MLNPDQDAGVQSVPPHALADRENIAALVDAFYLNVRADDLLGPIFTNRLDGHWDQHLPKMIDFWAGLALREKGYQGNLKAVHQVLPDLTPAHFNRWLKLFIDTVESHYEPAAAIGFIEPALRIAHSLQLSRFGWDFKIPAVQLELLEQINPRKTGEAEGREVATVGVGIATAVNRTEDADAALVAAATTAGLATDL